MAFVSAKAAAFVCKIFLVPGAFATGTGGAARFITSMDYFAEYRVFFELHGCSVKTGAFPPDATIEERALVLRDQVERFSQGVPVALIAHSQGGLDARFAMKKLGLAAKAPWLVTIGTPHQGSPAADWAVDQRERGSVLYWALRLIGDYDLRELRFLGEMTGNFLGRFAAFFEPASGAHYASARGVCHTGCHSAISRFGRWTGVGEGDGLVPAESQKFGSDLGAFDLDHLSEVGADEAKRSERIRLLEAVWGWLVRSR